MASKIEANKLQFYNAKHEFPRQTNFTLAGLWRWLAPTCCPQVGRGMGAPPAAHTARAAATGGCRVAAAVTASQGCLSASQPGCSFASTELLRTALCCHSS